MTAAPSMFSTLPIHRALREAPDRELVVCGERRSSRRRFAERVARLGGALRAVGVGTGDRVGILSLNSDRYLEAYFGTWWAGAAANPVNIRWSPREIAYSLDDCDTRVLIMDDTFAPMAPELRTLSTSLRTLIYAGDATAPEGMLDYETLLAQTAPVEDAMRGDEDLAAVMYTGGTTGRPKGVMQSHRALFAGTLGGIVSIGSPLRREFPTTALYSTPMFHVAGLAYMYQHMLRLNRHVLIPAFVPGAVLATIEAERVTETFMVPTMVHFLLEDHSFVARDLSSLQTLIYGAAPIDIALLERALARLPNVDFIHVYGMTELVGAIASLAPFYHTPEGRASGKLRSVGSPFVTAEVRIVDERGEPVPTGTVGEITTRGPMVMSGYWNRPNETAAALRDGWMHTGDGGFVDEDGFVTIVDRIKDMIISGGENVYSAEVESAIVQLPGIAMCCVIGVPDERWGERVHAVVVPKPDAQLDEAAIIAHCKTLIAGYKCPSSVEFVSELPLSPVGKILKYELRAAYAKAEAPASRG